MRSQLKLYLLGAPRVELDGEHLEVRPRKALALLIYLAVTANRHTRDALATLLWPNSDQRRGRRALRNRLSELNLILGGDWIEADRESVGLRAGCWLDLIEFQHCLEEDTDDPQRLITAVNLYRADFLTGFTLPDCPAFDEWQFFQTESVRQAVASTLEKLVRLMSNQAEYEAAIPYARRWLTLDPLHEPAHRQLMQLYAEAGQQAAALRQYEVCRHTLEDELGIAPAPETTTLYKQIRDRKSDVAEPTLLAVPMMVTPSFFSVPPVSLTPSPPFVAREGELAQLDQLLDTTLSGQGRVVFVTGEAGSGKTALVDEFSRQAMTEEPTLIVAGGICQAYTGMGDPYLPFREILELLTGDVETRWRAGSIDQDHAQRLWGLIPYSVQALVGVGSDLIDTFISGSALIERADAAAPDRVKWLTQLKQVVARQENEQRQAELQQTNLFEQYTQFLQGLARRRPLLLVLDDLQWADAGSISLLFHLGRWLEGHRILIVGIYRPADIALGRAGERHPLAPVINEFERYYGQMEISVKQTSDQQFVDQLVDTEPNRLDAKFRQALYQHTRGHALFTLEILRNMQARGDLVQDETGQWVAKPTLDWETLPTRIESIIGERLSRLPVRLQETLKVASVAGESFTAEVIAHIQAIDEREMIRWLSRELDQQHRLVRASGSRRVASQRLSDYRFRHILFQHYLYHSLDDIERPYLHESVGLALEQLYGERAMEVALPLARHFQAADMPAKAITYLQMAGDAAIQLYAGVEAAAHYRQALTLAEQGQADLKTRYSLYTRLGEALELDSKFDQALVSYAAVETLAHQHGDSETILAALMARTTILAAPHPDQDLAQAQTLSERALTLARRLDDRIVEARILSNLVTICRFSNRLSAAIDYGEQVLALARDLDLRRQIATTLNDLARCYGLSGHLDQSEALSREAIDLWREIDSPPRLADSLASASLFALFAGDYGRVIAYSQEAWQISEAINNIWNQSYSTMAVGYAHWERGQPDQALAVMEESIRLSKAVGFGVPQVLTQADLATIYGKLGAIERGLETAYLALKAAETQVPVYRSYVLATLAHLHLLNFDLVEAEAVINQANKDSNRNAIPLFAELIVMVEGELRLKQGHYEQALATTEPSLTTVRHFGMRRFLLSLLHLRGQAFLALGQMKQAQDCCLEARTVAEAMDARCSLWAVLFTLSQLEADSLEANQLRRQARKIVTGIVEHITTPDLQALFLDLPNVWAVLKGSQE